MNNLKMLLDKTGECATLENLAEECAELAHAALKLARIKRGECPTPATESDTKVKVHAEIADVLCVIQVLMQAEWFEAEAVDTLIDIKLKRWFRRMEISDD